MNSYLIILGILGLLGASAHIVLGERFIISPLNSEHLPTSFLGDGDVTKRYLRWFWHVGSILIVGCSLALVTVGIRYRSPEAQVLARAIGTGFISMFAAFLLVAIPRPSLFWRVPQGTILGIGGFAIWLVA